MVISNLKVTCSQFPVTSHRSHPSALFIPLPALSAAEDIVRAFGKYGATTGQPNTVTRLDRDAPAGAGS